MGSSYRGFWHIWCMRHCSEVMVTDLSNTSITRSLSFSQFEDCDLSYQVPLSSHIYQRSPYVDSFAVVFKVGWWVEVWMRLWTARHNFSCIELPSFLYISNRKSTSIGVMTGWEETVLRVLRFGYDFSFSVMLSISYRLDQLCAPNKSVEFNETISLLLFDTFWPLNIARTFEPI